MGVAKIPTYFSFSWSVTQLFCNFQVTLMVVYRGFEISQAVMDVAKISVRFSSS